VQRVDHLAHRVTAPPALVFQGGDVGDDAVAKEGFGRKKR